MDFVSFILNAFYFGGWKEKMASAFWNEAFFVASWITYGSFEVLFTALEVPTGRVWDRTRALFRSEPFGVCRCWHWLLI